MRTPELLSDPVYHNEEAARLYVQEVRWPDGVFCPFCGSLDDIKPLGGESMGPGWFYCPHCQDKFTVRVGSIFERSHIPLHKWLLAFRLMSSSKKGISAHQLHRTLGITYKSAWFLAHRIRESMTDTDPTPLGGKGQVIEADETYIGRAGDPKDSIFVPGKGWIRRGGDEKMTLVERGGKARSVHIGRVTARELNGALVRHADPQSRLMTDELPGYRRPGKRFAAHETVNHTAKEWVRDEAHTNTVEGYYSIFKRGMKGVYQHCTEKHLHRYLGIRFSLQQPHRPRLTIASAPMGRDFALKGVYFCQQTGITHVCAHSALRMGLNTANRVDPLITGKSINDQLKVSPPFPNGLSLAQVRDVIISAGYEDNIYDCTLFTKEEQLTLITSMVESGFITLLGFSTPGVAGHVVTVFGHTRNSDEWHPQALPAYAGPSGNEFYSSSGWIDHFIIHDDNFGPYYSLSARALEVDPRIQAQIIVPLCPIKIVNSSVWAESTASLFLNNLLADIQSAAQPYATGDWWSYITASDRKYILRSILISREDYLRHIGSICGHDLSRMKQTELMLFRGLPELFWMVEFTLPALYTGNRSKLGEVLLSSVARRDPTNLGGLFLGIRMPKVFASLDAMGTAIIAHQVSLDSHASLFRIRDHDNQW